jgi:hypothetical protein
MALDRTQLIARKTKIQKHREVQLPSGDSVNLRVPIARDYRDWKKFLRDEKGDLIDARAELGDELLLASILVNPDGTPMFTREDVLGRCMDEIIQPDLECLKEKAYEFFGMRSGFKIVLDEDREKNSSATQPSE